LLLVVLSTVELAWIIAKGIVTSPSRLLQERELLNLFGFVLLVLIGVELLATVKAYLADSMVHVEVVLEVALIAIARKVIVLDVKDYEALQLVAMAFLVSALALAYFVARHQRTARSVGGGEPPA
jgi:uncharacterized membrane protein (DUF373 family)